MLEISNFDLRRYWQILLHRLWIVVLTFFLAVSAAFFWHKWAKPVYESTTLIQLGSGRFITDELDKTVRNVSETPKRFRRTSEISLKQQDINREYLLALADSLGFRQDSTWQIRAKEIYENTPHYTIEELRENLMLKALAKKISIYVPRGSSLYYITGRSSDPTTAYRIAKCLGNIYIEDFRKRELAAIQSSYTFSLQQMNDFKEKLEKAENRLQKFRTNLMLRQIKDKKVNSKNLTQVNRLQTSLSVELESKKQKLEKLGRNGNGPGLTPSSRLLELKSSLIAKNTELTELMLEFDWNSRELYKIRTDIAKIRQDIKAEIRDLAGKVLNSNDVASFEHVVRRLFLEIEIESLQHQIGHIEKLLQFFEDNETALPAHEIMISRLEDEVEKYRRLYDMFESQAIGSEVERNLQIIDAQSRYRIVEAAVKPLSPSNTSLELKMMLAAVIGIGLGLGIIFLLEYIDRSFKSIEEIEKELGLPVLGTLPKVNFLTHNRDLKYVFLGVVISVALAAILLIVFYLKRLSF